MTVAGESLSAPALLDRQSVVAGVSDGAIKKHLREDSPVQTQLPEVYPCPTESFSEMVSHQPLRDELPGGFDAAISQFERWCQVLLLDAFQRLGFFRSVGVVHSRASIEARVAPEHSRMLSEQLAILEVAGFVTPAPAATEALGLTLSAAGGGPAVAAELTALAETGRTLEAQIAPDVASNMRLIRVCMEALPEILVGRVKVPDIMFPGGSPELVEPIYKNPKLSAPFNEQLAGMLRGFVVDRLSVIPSWEKVRIVEVGSGSGGTSAVVMPELLEFGDRVEFVYTDISAQLVGYGRKTYGPR